MSTETIIQLAVLAALALWLVIIFNRLVAMKNRFANAFAQIEVQLKRRHDLVPNLVETARGYLKHEAATLEAVIAARNQASAGLRQAAANPASAAAMAQLSAAEGMLGSALGRLNVVVEQYPELKADATMAQLGEELASTENRIAFARQAYNDFVTEYNTYRQSFPQNFVAGPMGHRADGPLLEFDDRAAIAVAPRVTF